jgi:hypothetical protein
MSDIKYKYRKSWTGKWILQVLKEVPAPFYHGGIFDERRVLAWVDADAVDMRVATYILNKHQ